MQIKPHFYSTFFFIALAGLFSFSEYANATKVSTIVGATFSTSATNVQIGGQVDFILHVRASKAANQVNIQYHIPPQVRLAAGGTPWSGALAADQQLDFPISVIVQQAGEFTLSASVEAVDFRQTKNAWMVFLATQRGVYIGAGIPASVRMRLMTPPQLRRFQEKASRPANVKAMPVAPATPSEQRLNIDRGEISFNAGLLVNPSVPGTYPGTVTFTSVDPDSGSANDNTGTPPTVVTQTMNDTITSGATAWVFTDATHYGSGHTMKASVAIDNPGAATHADVYLALLLPTGGLLFVQFDPLTGQPVFSVGNNQSSHMGGRSAEFGTGCRI